jgi:hypothetical protein
MCCRQELRAAYICDGVAGGAARAGRAVLTGDWSVAPLAVAGTLGGAAASNAVYLVRVP